MTTIYEVAKAAGVSTATVSRVFSGASVSPERAQRVRAAAAKLSFEPNHIARSLRLQRTDVIALIIPDIENPFFTSLARGVEDAARSTALSVVLCNSDENIEQEAKYLQVAIAQRMAGVVIAAASQKTTDLRPLLSRNTPVVAVDRRPRNAPVDVVMVDNHSGGRQATAHLAEKGYRVIACITGPPGAWTADERLSGYAEEITDRLKADGATPEECEQHLRHYVRRGDFRSESGHSAMMSLLAMHDPPDAVFVANNLMTVGVIEALREAGMRPPQLGIISFGDLPWKRLLSPMLSAISQPSYQLGWAAAGLLQDRIAGHLSPTKTVILSTELVERESSAGPISRVGAVFVGSKPVV